METAGVLAYRGIDIHELAEHSDFEETTYLLWYGHLPNSQELERLHKELAAERALHARIYDLLRMVPPGRSAHGGPAHGGQHASLYDADEKD